ncbi:hypothetical protein D1AOALGA4SA_5981 [Olavius algarvensis Delta 1 endosymbiont]|nr:hypothetical protein D1AOALGA4SA_5981 [Olavius algarvensis Delta 1 endosymbiont]
MITGRYEAAQAVIDTTSAPQKKRVNPFSDDGPEPVTSGQFMFDHGSLFNLPSILRYHNECRSSQVNLVPHSKLSHLLLNAFSQSIRNPKSAIRNRKSAFTLSTQILLYTKKLNAQRGCPPRWGASARAAIKMNSPAASRRVSIYDKFFPSAASCGESNPAGFTDSTPLSL